jgi:4-amino-4-deoxy-L-arabinose transferase-like glycosyltransferase
LQASDRSHRALPQVVAALLIVVLAAFYGRMLPVGSLQHVDEYLTLDRVHSLTTRDDWLTIYSENQPTFKKPPLQYWISALLIEGGLDEEVALRAPSYVFAIALLPVVGLIAWLVLPANSWVAPIAILLTASSKRFWESAISALLDSGATFFAAVALAGTLLAMRQPRWWYAVAFACAIAPLQKAPAPLVFSAVAIAATVFTRPWQDDATKQLAARSFRSRHFLISVGVALLLLLAWPVAMWLYHGGGSLHEAYVDQMFGRFAPGAEEQVGKRSIYTLLIAGEPFLRIVAVAAAFWLPWRMRRIDLISFPGLVLLYLIVVLVASGFVSPRYSLLLLPILMASLAAMILVVLPGWKSQIAAIAALSLASLGPFKTASALGLLDEGQTRYIPLLRSIGAAIRPEETLLVCNRSAGERIYSGAVSVYASGGHRIVRIKSAEQLLRLQEEGAIRPPYRSICSIEQFEALKPILRGTVTIEVQGAFAHWTATGASGGAAKPE